MDLMTYLLAVKNGSGQGVTYTLSADTLNKKIVLTPSEGDAQSITVPYATDASTINGHDVPELENGKIPAAYLPSYVDDVAEYTSRSDFPSEGESGKIYIDLTTNKIYRWSGSIYAEISESLALGETSATAYRGDRGKTAYDHSQVTGNPHGTTLADLNGDSTHRTVTDDEKTTWNGKQDSLTFDDVPINESTNPVKSGGVYSALATKSTIDTDPSGLPMHCLNKIGIDGQVYNFALSPGYAEVPDLPADIASFSDGADNEPLAKLEVGIEAVQSGSGDPSPSNVRPISGWDSVSCVTDGSCIDTLTPLYNATYYSLYFSKATIQAEPNTDYYVNSNSPNALIQSQTLETTFIVCPEEDTPTTVDFGVVNGEELHIKTKSSGVITIYYRVRKGSSGIIQLTTPQDFKDGTYYLQITKTSTNNQRLGATYTIQLGDTYYGATLDVTSGVLTVDKKKILLTGADTPQGISTTYAGSIIYNSQSQKFADIDYSKEMSCNLLKFVGRTVSNFTYGTFISATSPSVNLWIKDGAFADSAEVATWLNNNNVEILCYLATPITIQLTPTQVKSLLKDNNIWADSGQIKDCVYMTFSASKYEYLIDKPTINNKTVEGSHDGHYYGLANQSDIPVIEANPEGETPTDDLESLKVGEKTYAIPEGGSSEPFFVNVVLDENGYSESESTYEDIIEAVSNNRPVFMNWSNPNEAQYFTIKSVNRVPLSALINDEIDPFARFTYIYCGDSDATFLSVTFKPEQGVFSEENSVSWS